MVRLVRTPLWLVFIYVILEIAFRIHRYEKLTGEFEQNTRYAFSSFQQPLYTVDTAVGYAYIANSRNRQFLYKQDGELLPHNSHIMTNNAGMFSPYNVQLEKKPDEYRIAVLGDSFCATTTSDVVWPTVLQDSLNADAKLKRAVKINTFTVLNLGLDGTGFAQWPDNYRYRAAPFEPDLVIVNFISHDIIRKFVYCDTLTFDNANQAMFTCTSLPVSVTNPRCRNWFAFVMDAGKEDARARSEAIKKSIYMTLLRTLPWFSPYPELLAAATKGHIGLRPRLEIVVSRPGIFGLSNLFYEDEDEARKVSLNALRQIVSMHPSLLVFHHPDEQEVLAGKTSDRGQRFVAAASDIPIIDMVNELPMGQSVEEINKWYNGPDDTHPSNYGAKIYGETAEQEVRAMLLGNLGKPRAKH